MSVDLAEVLARFEENLRKKVNVLGFSVTATKIKGGVDTGRPCIRIYVAKKLAFELLAPEEVIPKILDGIETDVVELAAKDWDLGQTSKGQLSPDEQARLAGVKRK